MRRRRARAQGPPGCSDVRYHCASAHESERRRKGDSRAVCNETGAEDSKEYAESRIRPGCDRTLRVADAEIVRRVCAGESALFEILMRRQIGGCTAPARAVVKDEGEVEDVSSRPTSTPSRTSTS